MPIQPVLILEIGVALVLRLGVFIAVVYAVDFQRGAVGQVVPGAQIGIVSVQFNQVADTNVFGILAGKIGIQAQGQPGEGIGARELGGLTGIVELGMVGVKVEGRGVIEREESAGLADIIDG